MSDIQTLFQTDPLNLTREDLKETAAYYREKRNAFNLGDMQAGSTKKMAKKDTPKINIDQLLSDL
jgi:hypothetical protein